MKIVRFIGIAALTLLITSPICSAFSDVSENHPYADGIAYVRTEGIASGYADGSFLPDHTINRAEFTKIVIGATIDAKEIQSCAAGDLLAFPDTSPEAWYSPFICTAVARGIVGGYPDGTFRPERVITFPEAAKILVESFGLAPSGGDESVWFRPYTESLAERGAIPLSIGNFAHEVTRGEMAEMIYRLREDIRTESTQTYSVLAFGRQELMGTAEDGGLGDQYAFRQRQGEGGGWDASLIVRAGSTQLETTLVESIREAIPEFQVYPNSRLEHFASPPGEDRIFFRVMNTAGAEPLAGKVYEFHLARKEFRPLSINSMGAFTSMRGSVDVSSDGRRFLWAPNYLEGFATTIYVVDLLTDSYRKVVQLYGDETLCASSSATVSTFEIEWLDARQFRYAVFDQGKKVGAYEDYAIRKGYRVLDVGE